MTTDKTLRSDDVFPKLDQLVRVGLALSHEKDLATLLEMIVTTARSLTNADAGTLYITDRGSRRLQFKIMQNDTAKSSVNAVRDPEAPIPPPVPLHIDGVPNKSNVSSYVGLTGETVNIPDVYTADGFNFSGVKKYDETSGYRSKSMLVIPMKNHESEIIGVLQLLNARAGGSVDVIGFSDLDAAMVSSLASQAAVALTSNSLLSRLESDLETIRRLRDSEKELGDRLREAFIKTERSNEELKAALGKVWIVRLAGFIFVLVMAAIGAVSYHGAFGIGLFPDLHSLVAETKAPATSASGDALPAEKIALVKPAVKPVSKSLILSGRIEPVEQITVVCPFQGKIADVLFRYGREVKAGDPLVVIDSSEVMVRHREAESAVIRADQNLRTLMTWETGGEVTRARMNQARGKATLDSLKRKLDEAKLMFDRGIVARIEFEAAQEAFDNQVMNDRAAADEIRSLLDRCAPENIRIAEMELKNARVRLEELQSQIERSTVKAPVNGVVLKLAGSAARPVAKGAAVEQGQGLVIVGNLDGIALQSQVEEIDLGKIRVGQEAVIVGEAFPDLALDGVITLVACQAAGASGEGGDEGDPPSFEVTATVASLTPEQKEALRVGMSAEASVTTYDNPEAMVVPGTAVLSEGGEFYLWRADTGGVGLKKTPVEIGVTTVDDVEILSGIEPDDLVAARAEDVKP